MVLRALVLAGNSHRLCNARSPQPAARAIASARAQGIVLTALPDPSQRSPAIAVSER